MKRMILIAAAGCLALTFPALAQNNPNGSPQSNSNHQQSQTVGSNSQMGKQSQQQNSGQMQASNGQQTVQPSSLSRQQIREIQSSLDKSGFNAKHVDGIWGRETEDAVREFQQAKHLPGNGQLDQQTLSALGVNIGNQTQSASSNQDRQQNASSSQTGQSQSQTVGQSQSKPSSPQGTGQNTKNK